MTTTPIAQETSAFGTSMLDCLVEALLDRLGRSGTLAGGPAEHDGDLAAEGTAGEEDSASGEFSLCPFPVGDVLGALLEDLHQRELDLFTCGHVAETLVNPVYVTSLGDDGQVESHICTRVAGNEHGALFVPLDMPVDIPALSLTCGLALDDRVRVLRELVRLFGDAVGFPGLSDSLRGQVVSSLRTLVGMLRVAVGEMRIDESSSSNDDGEDVNGKHEPQVKPAADSPSDDPAETRTTGPFRTLTDHLEDLIRVDEILARAFPRTPSRERIGIAVEITGALKWGAL